jgi:hypothetical protein
MEGQHGPIDLVADDRAPSEGSQRSDMNGERALRNER